MKDQPKKTKVTTPGDCEIRLTREFDAPRQLVFEAFTRPETIQRWLTGPDGWSMPECEVDLRVGGKYHYTWRNTGGREFGSGGEFLEIVPPERIVFTEKFDGDLHPGGAVITVVLTEIGGKTLLTQTMRTVSKEARDAAIESGMLDGTALCYDRLEELLA
jgi:uncharacterized protein YndB with AHSA1/START domain